MLMKYGIDIGIAVGDIRRGMLVEIVGYNNDGVPLIRQAARNSWDDTLLRLRLATQSCLLSKPEQESL